MTAKYGTPYFSNYINSDMEPSDVRSMCCRLRLDLRELRKKSGRSLFPVRHARVLLGYQMAIPRFHPKKLCLCGLVQKFLFYPLRVLQ